MKEIHPKIKIAILRILRDANHPIGSAVIAHELKSHGFELSSRSIRLYLQYLEDKGLVGKAMRGREGGRSITPKGIVEIRDAQVFDRVGYTSVKIDSLACQTTLHLAMRTGLIVLNVSTIERDDLLQAVEEMLPVFESGLSMGEHLTFCREGENLGHFTIPERKVGIGTVCSVTLNGVMLNHGIPMTSRFGGVLEYNQKQCTRFTDVIDYAGTSLDPLEVFIKGKLTSVRETARQGNGRIGASFRETPSPVVSNVELIHRKLKIMGLGGILLIGTPNQPLLDFPVQEGRTGLLVAGGLNPIAAVEEAGISTMNYALCTLYSFEKLFHYREMQKRAKDFLDREK
ncbi:MAG: DUF128 domain-containing protein [Candidatus Omnitrophica bacterium]|nr:DUF128 domain-containing protein [Candidatus Omnitrophota bacterium]